MKTILIGCAACAGLGLAAMTTAMAGPGKGGDRFDRLDANGDGKITAEEMDEKHAAWIAEVDSDGDGAVTKEEAKAFREARRAEWREKRNPDKNGDGVVDREEYMTAAEERFEAMDKNDDGVISDDEKKGPRRRRH